MVRGQELPTAYVRAKFEDRTRSFIRLRNIGTFRCAALIDPVTLTFDLLTLKSVWESHVTWGTPVQSFVFLVFLVFELEPMYATSDRRTTDADHRLMPPPLRGGTVTVAKTCHASNRLMMQDLVEATSVGITKMLMGGISTEIIVFTFTRKLYAFIIFSTSSVQVNCFYTRVRM